VRTEAQTLGSGPYSHPYSPKCVEGEFSEVELRIDRVLETFRIQILHSRGPVSQDFRRLHRGRSRSRIALRAAHDTLLVRLPLRPGSGYVAPPGRPRRAFRGPATKSCAGDLAFARFGCFRSRAILVRYKYTTRSSSPLVRVPILGSAYRG
jgi:hypothetical protein